MKLAFGTDWHLDAMNFDARVDFLKKVNSLDVDGIIVSGDIGCSYHLENFLVTINNLIDKPFYFVHGNHDFYGSSFHETREKTIELTSELERVHWLESRPVRLTPTAAIFGVDGWYDGGYGNYFFDQGYEFQMLDFDLIKELKFKNKEERLKTFETFAYIGANGIRRELPKLLEENDLVIFATHVPPFVSLCRHNGQPTNDNSLPFFASRAIGEALIEVKDKYPDKELLVLCGHTHDEATLTVGNMNCICAPARYGRPAIYTTIEIK